MKFLKASLICMILGLLGANLGLSIANHQKLMNKPSDAPSVGDQLIIQQINQLGTHGHQQRTILMQRLLGLEHIHNMHPENNIKLCPGCEFERSQSKNSVAVKN